MLCQKKRLKIPKGQSESVNRRRTDNTMAKRIKTKKKTIYKTYTLNYSSSNMNPRNVSRSLILISTCLLIFLLYTIGLIFLLYTIGLIFLLYTIGVIKDKLIMLYCKVTFIRSADQIWILKKNGIKILYIQCLKFQLLNVNTTNLQN